MFRCQWPMRVSDPPSHRDPRVNSFLGAIAALTGGTAAIAARTTPPTEQDFTNYFEKNKNSIGFGNVVFWSGTGDAEAERFARANGRKTLEMVVGDNWKQFQSAQGDTNGYWSSWDQCVQQFWIPASRAFARFVYGDVFFYATTERLVDQTRPDCSTCWFNVEKPILIASKESNANPKVTLIQKFQAPWTAGQGSIGVINTMADK